MGGPRADVLHRPLPSRQRLTGVVDLTGRRESQLSEVQTCCQPGGTAELERLAPGFHGFGELLRLDAMGTPSDLVGDTCPAPNLGVLRGVLEQFLPDLGGLLPFSGLLTTTCLQETGLDPDRRRRTGAGYRLQFLDGFRTQV